MAGPIAIDTPDYQRGIVSAQKLLAHVTGIQTSVIVGIPPNTETLVVTTFVHAVNQPITVTGQTTGIVYPSVPLYPNTVPGVWQTYWVDVSQAVDDEVEVEILGSSAFGWYVYADSGVHLTADVGGVRTLAGIPYTIPMAPSESAGDHPPNELAVAGGLVSTGVNLIAPAGAGSRYRLFALNIADNGSSSDTYIVETSTGQPLLACAAPGSAVLSYPVTGHPLTVNTTLQAGSTSSTRQVFAMMYYTLENF